MEPRRSAETARAHFERSAHKYRRRRIPLRDRGLNFLSNEKTSESFKKFVPIHREPLFARRFHHAGARGMQASRAHLRSASAADGRNAGLPAPRGHTKIASVLLPECPGLSTRNHE